MIEERGQENRKREKKVEEKEERITQPTRIKQKEERFFTQRIGTIYFSLPKKKIKTPLQKEGVRVWWSATLNSNPKSPNKAELLLTK